MSARSSWHVAKSITFCKHLGLDIVGLIENMSGFKCPGCGEITHIFNKGGGKLLAERMQIPFLGEISMDPEIANATDIGKPFISGEKGSVAMDQFREILKKIEKRD
ncbi:MAG: P-loop NTPase [Verrucomicrobiota bacterium]|nr:P-loop NTPase [Verrucomicrobiota bacterium]